MLAPFRDEELPCSVDRGGSQIMGRPSMCSL